MKLTLRPRYYSNYNQFVERVEVDLHEVLSDEAPLAVVSNQGTTRWYNDRHFKRYDLPVSVEQATPIESVIITLENDAWYNFKGHTLKGVPCSTFPTDTNLFSGYFAYARNAGEYVYAHSRYPNVTECPNRKLALEGVSRFANDCIVVDDALWVACTEPRLVVKDSIYIDMMEHVGDSVIYNMALRKSVTMDVCANTFSLFEADLALQVADRHNVDPSLPQFTVLLPESIQYDRRKQSLIIAADIVLKNFTAPIHSIDPEIAASLLGMSRCVWQRGHDSIDLEGLAESLVEFVRIQAKLGMDVRSLLSIIEAWEDRDLLLPNTRTHHVDITKHRL